MHTYPLFIYGTAWKKERTTDLVVKAVKAGFRAIDTANQPKHYSEPLVGEALQKLTGDGVVQRDELWLQTKFTPVDGQDSRIPYDPRADLTTQVNQSFEKSLEQLHTAYVDSYVLHGPYSYPGLTDSDFEVWAAMEAIQKSGRAKEIGISNVNQAQIEVLHKETKTKPKWVQNRCFAVRGWDRGVREFCRANGIAYQGFSLLTANMHLFEMPEIHLLARKYEAELPQVVFKFASQAGMVPLTGTTDVDHMKMDLESLTKFDLTADEVKLIERISA